ncbi:MAG: SpoIID/LytB domain-containing protein [Gaiellaceae bacterium]
MTRRALSTLILCVVALTPVFAPVGAVAGREWAKETPATTVWAPATLVISGHGWGHGVGLSQYGAYGFAQHGYTYDQIVAHYFPGTDLEYAGSKTIRVLLASGRSSLTISSATPFKVTDASGTSYDVADLSLQLDSSLSINLTAGGSPSLAGPLVFTAGSSPLAFAGRTYRGKFNVAVVGDKLRLINYVGLEPYLYGVVPCESPHDWPADALEAQAIVARSYALVSIKPSSSFDVYADTRSQVYHGRSGEYPESTAAVDSTTGETVYYDGAVARTFFFSTSGGRTAAIQDAWPNALPEPYLVSVNDPYDNLSPYHNWGPVTLPSQTLAKNLKIAGPISDLTIETNGSQRVSTATLTGARDETFAVSGDAVRQALDLRSSWFEAAVFALQRPTSALPYGTSVRVSGRARGADSPVLEIRPSGGTWQTAATLSPDDSGLFQVTLKPRSTSYYRIVDGDIEAAPVRVPVAPRVRLARMSGGGLRGSVRPLGPAAVVELQRLRNDSWTTIARLPLGSSGSFARAGVLRAGQYRARVSGLEGLVSGLSPVVVLGS